MTKAEITRQTAEGMGITIADCRDVMEALLMAISSELGHGGKIELRKFGVFKVELRDERVARDPKTGQEIRIPQRPVPVFKPSNHLKKRVLDGALNRVLGEDAMHLEKSRS